MKQFYILFISLTSLSAVNAQMILNEVYCSPGAGNHEFFELYNNSTNTTPSSVDGITMVTYFEEGTNQGFYVMDLPNLTVPSRGFFVGSSAIPFNYQGISGSTRSDFNWNNAAFLAANNGYLKKWIASNANPSDGNPLYDEVAVPANLNDLFYRKGQGGASYSIMVFQNGILLSAFFGGSGGGGNIPGFIVGMPKLHIDMSSTATDFDIDFPNATGIKGEFVIEDAGSDNGFMRTKDGMCGEWTKSSANVFHTPKMTNGSQTGTTGDISVSRAVVRGTAATGSVVNYDVVGAPSYAFPITLQVYLDDGSITGQLDVEDTYIESNIEYSLSDGGFSTLFTPHDYDVLIVVNSVVGCIDKILYTPNSTVLPLKLISLVGRNENGKAILNWNVSENEAGHEFNIEKSIDGKNFSTIAAITTNAKTGRAHYSFTDQSLPEGNSYYRIKIINKDNSISYSKVILVQAQTNTSDIRLLQNPVSGKLKFKYNASVNSTLTINVYNSSGIKLHTSFLTVQKNANALIDLDLQIPPGIYILEVGNSIDRKTTKFIRR